MAIQATIQAKEAKIAADAAVGENRAWMVPVDNGKVRDYSISVTFKNIGHSPAIQVRAMEESIFDIERYGPPGTPVPKFGSCDHLLRHEHSLQSASVISPDGTFEINLPTPQGTPTSETTSVATTHGCMFYIDVLTGQKRYTEYCYRSMTDHRKVTVTYTCPVKKYDDVIIY
jgi:hypothetical protein